MCRVFETVLILNGVPKHPEWHEKRMARARLELFGITDLINIKELLNIPSAFRTGAVRCTIQYDREIREISFRNYEKRKISSLKMVVCDDIDYDHKFTDRTVLNSLYEQRENCDEIIIVKNGMITDSSISNLIFYDGRNWVTPERPLLRGSCRDRLIAAGMIIPEAIIPAHLKQFKGCRLINALRDPEGEEIIPVEYIR